MIELIASTSQIALVSPLLVGLLSQLAVCAAVTDVSAVSDRNLTGEFMAASELSIWIPSLLRQLFSTSVASRFSSRANTKVRS